jgi:putative transposase
MSKPGRNASPESILRPARTFFVTTKTSMGLRLLQTERNAGLLIDALRSLVAERTFELHDFVIMPDHVHLLMTVDEGMTVEKAMQLVKGRFSYRLSHEAGYKGEIWQRGFSEVQVLDRANFDKHREYIALNPVKAGLVSSPDQHPYCFGFLARSKAASRLKANIEAHKA